MKSLIFFFFLSLPISCLAQDLHIRFQESLPREYAGSWWLSDDSKYKKIYTYKSYICYNPLLFMCSDRATSSETLPISALSNYTALKTIEQVETTVAGMSTGQVFQWFKTFQNIYIVEILPNGTQIEVSKVRLATTNK